MDRARELHGEVHVVVADYQTAGHGQNGRVWQSPPKQNIYLSVLYPFFKSPSHVQGLSLAVGVSLIQSLEKLGIHDLKLKWPNDIFYQGKKLAGILVETTCIEKESCAVVVGIGLNVNMDFNQKIDQPWTSLKIMSKKLWDREELRVAIVKDLLESLNIFEEKGYEAFHENFLKYEI